MKKKTVLKLVICLLFVLFNALGVFCYMHITHKISLNNSINTSFNDIEFSTLKINDKYKEDSIHYFKLQKSKGNKYSLVSMDIDIFTLLKMFTDYELMSKYQIETNFEESQYIKDNKVYNYNDYFSLGLNENELDFIEVYEKEKVFLSGIELNNYDQIEKVLGKSKVVKIKDIYNYYSLTYKYEDIYVNFVSFYEDGRKNICILTKNEF